MIRAISDYPTRLTIANPQFQRFLFSYWLLAFQPFQNYILDFAPFGSVRREVLSADFPPVLYSPELYIALQILLPVSTILYYLTILLNML